MSHPQFNKPEKPCSDSWSKCTVDTTLRELAGLAPVRLPLQCREEDTASFSTWSPKDSQVISD